MFYILLGVLLGVVIYKLIQLSKFWEDKNVNHEPTWPIVGNMGGVLLQKQHTMDLIIDLYRKHSHRR